jgi:ribose-phosphate pyrophosphokinase
MIVLNTYAIITEQFPNKETKMKDFDPYILKDNLLEFTYQEDGDLIKLLFVKKRIDQEQVNCKLVINYMPYSRMDRKIEGDLFTLQYICAFINDLHFEKVYVIEPHSAKTIELLRNSEAIYPALDWLPAIMDQMQFTDQDRIVFPDKGAAARYHNTGYDHSCIFDKTRNPETGRIENMLLKQGDIPKGAKCIIVDDLCSAGGTFLWAGQTLKQMGASEIYLLVTHCELRVLSGKLLDQDSPIDKVFTSTSMMQQTHPKIEYITINLENYV